MNEESSLARKATAAAISSGLGEPAHRDVHQAARGALGVLGEQLLEQRGVDRPRAQRVDPDALAGELHAQLAGHGEDAALGGGVARSARSRRPSRATNDAVLMIEPLPWRRM